MQVDSDTLKLPKQIHNISIVTRLQKDLFSLLALYCAPDWYFCYDVTTAARCFRPRSSGPGGIVQCFDLFHRERLPVTELERNRISEGSKKGWWGIALIQHCLGFADKKSCLNAAQQTQYRQRIHASSAPLDLNYCSFIKCQMQRMKRGR